MNAEARAGRPTLAVVGATGAVGTVMLELALLAFLATGPSDVTFDAAGGASLIVDGQRRA